MCGVVGVVTQDNVATVIVSALKGLQHRGQQSVGLAVCNNKQVFLQKKIGLVQSLANEIIGKSYVGNLGVGHVRYSTAGVKEDESQAQPFYVNYPFGVLLVHNGHIVNIDFLLDYLNSNTHRHLLTSSDSEILLNIFAYQLGMSCKREHLTNTDIFTAISQLHKLVKGSYSVVSTIIDYGLVAFRDPYGIRPLILGKQEYNGNTNYMIASESNVLELNGYNIVRDVLPGETVIITKSGELFSNICATHTSLNICIFEYIYLARPDSFIEGVSVQLARKSMATYLANKIKSFNLPIDVVIAVPETSRVIAIEVARILQKDYCEGFVKNHFTGRSFLYSNQKQRKLAVLNKLNIIRVEFTGKNVLLIDDSIVRGNTACEIISYVRSCNVKGLYFASAAPQVCYPNIYGIDMPDINDLIAHNKTDKEISDLIGADKIIFQNLEDLKQSILDLTDKEIQFETSCFDGNYLVT